MKSFFLLFLLFVTPIFGGENCCKKKSPLSLPDNLLVACSDPRATRVGLDILEQGGSALDAALAIQMALGVLEPENSGLGGGSIILHYEKEKQSVTIYDGRECAPKCVGGTATTNHCGGPANKEIKEIGGTAVAVPGTLKAFEMAYQEHGKLPWAKLFQPAIDLAARGASPSPKLKELIKTDTQLSQFNSIEDLFFGGQKQSEQSSIINPRLAFTLHAIAQNGAKQFYQGSLAQRVIHTVRGASVNPGCMTVEDLYNYQAIRSQPILFKYRDFEIAGAPPPSVGGIGLAQILGILSHHHIEKYDFDSLEFVNLFSQASQLSYADLNYFVGDPAFFPTPVKALLDPHYIAKRAHLVKKHHALEKICEGEEPKKDLKSEEPLVACHHYHSDGMTHFCVVDKAGNAVAVSSCLGKPFGSKLNVEGFFLNSSMSDFCEPGLQSCAHTANHIKGGKRPVTYMSPTFVFDQNKRLILAIGSAGSGAVVDYVAEALLGKLVMDKPLQVAIDAPHYVALTDEIFLEKGTKLREFLNPLKAMGHRVFMKKLNSGTTALELTKKGEWRRAIDSRL